MGPFGTTITLPIINQPQVAILATDAITKEPVVVEGPDGEDTIAIHHVGLARARLGPPRVRRRVRGVVPERGAQRARDPRLGRRARMTPGADPEARSRREARDEAEVAPHDALARGGLPYREAEALQRALHERSDDDYLLLQEHPHVYTLGSRADLAHVLRDPQSVGAELVHADRGGDVTYHGPGQLVGYPIVSLAEWRAGQRDVVAYVRKLEVGARSRCSPTSASRRRPCRRLTGVWVGDEKIAAIGVRVARGRTRHGFALNVDPDLTMFDHIVPCGIRDHGVTSLAQVLGAAPDDAATSSTASSRGSPRRSATLEVERQDVAWRARGRRPLAVHCGDGVRR